MYISYDFWNKIPYLWSPVCHSFGSKFNNFLIAEIQRPKISERNERIVVVTVY